MKIIFTLFICVSSVFVSAQKEPFNEEKCYKSLAHLASKKDYFEVKEIITKYKSKIDPEVYFYYLGLVENGFSHFKESNEAIESFLVGSGQMNNDSLFKEILMIKQLNLISLFEYEEASNLNQYILENFNNICTPVELDDLLNTGKIWKALENSGKQKITHSNDARIQLTRDKANLANIPVTISDKKKNFVFDTGANFSVIQRSVALEMNLEIMPIQFDVSAITGATVKSDLAVAKELFIGGIKCENVVFLVFDDADLTFSEADYSIQGIIGFPVIRNLDEIHLNSKDELFIPKIAQEFPVSNLIINGFVPVVQVIKDSDTLNFTFDTGAAETSLNSSYYSKYKKKIERKGKKQLLKSGGAGGIVEYEGYLLPQVTLSVGTSKAKLVNMQVRKDVVGETDGLFEGNLGQDFIKQFETMVISFKYSHILFK
ncbi:retropepsin-like aspartic protease [Fluviicola taffensis]|uniref:Peptidase A2 domain-containing protein n=1 Tax=Fluviicola taffensis (strain DSM 16823 / NCIMB 13979 / RW262) TaxID=755732 RepID=F2IGE1_FLUTR|nr:retropepsin-like aspartic protease [Fluviicola taffensis]AEA45807.1 hypothetical protein Fluta_3841 [Fluviicola taffensis DSM 16823]